MSPRREVQDVLARFAFAYELLEGPTPRARTYAAAARTIFQLEGDLAELRASGALAKVRGLGSATLAVVDDVLAGREPAELVALEAKIPSGLFAVREVRGLGPAKVRALYEGLGIASLGELEHACRENRLVTLAGFGAKTQAKVLEGVQERRRREEMWLRDAALTLAERMQHALAVQGISDVRIVGALARGDEIIEKIELLAVTDAAALDVALRAALDVDVRTALEEPAGATGEDPVRATPQSNGNDELSRVVVHRAEATNAGLAEVRLTSDEAHLAQLVARASERQLTLADDALFDARRTPIACATADSLYAALDLLAVAAEARSADTPLARIGKARTALIRREDLRGALHNHTVASDGNATLSEMRAAAVESGLEYLGISEHSVSADYARGLSVERLAAQGAEITALNRSGSGCTLLTGIESDILSSGALDYADDVLRTLQVIIASSHRRFALDRAASTARMVRAARDPNTDIIGHPTGRLLLARPALDFDIAVFLDACAESGCAVELNGSAHRLDFGARELAMAKERGVCVSIAADAHAPPEIEEHLMYGVAVARRAGLTADDVLNAKPLAELELWLAARRARRAS